jgi:CO/xanthine dehydrogenase Mo-binding subunit
MPGVNTSSWRNDARAKVTGATKFTDDLKFARLLHAVPVYSDFVHARLRAVRTEEAASVEGVVRVLTAHDVPGTNRFGQIIRDFRIFADDKIRYNGDVVAVVVAESREIALRAAALVRVDADPLPNLLDPEEALQPGAVLIHENHGTNIINTHKVRRGDIDRGFSEADVIVEEDFTTQFIEHAYMEPEVSVCVPRPDGVIEIYGSMQHPFSTRRFAAACLGVPLADVEVVGTPLGGGFGGKDDTAAIVSARTALAAKLTGRPVKMRYTRDWSIRESYKRHPYRVRYSMGVTKAGKITAVRCRIVADGGAYCSVTPWVTWRSTVQCCGPYVVENVQCDTFGVYTNNVVTGAMRGFGSPQMNFVIDQMVEIAAEKIGMSSIEFRRINMVRQNSITITGQKLDTHTVAMEQVLDAVLCEIGYEEKLKKCAFGKGEGDELYGIGIAMSYRGVSLGAEGVDFCAAIINVQADGSVILEVGVHENGQGSESAMILLLAEQLGVAPEKIRYRRSSTSVIPDSGTTVASRGTIMGGGAVCTAAGELKKKIAEAVADQIGAKPADIRFTGSRLVAVTTDKSISFEDAVRYMYNHQQFPYALGVFRAPKVSWHEENGQGTAYFTWVYGCQAVELTVNKRTGKIKLLNAVAAHDIGKAVNREMVLGQIYGGMAMSIGYALHEEVQMTDGVITNRNLNTYRVPRSLDIPPMKAVIIENADPVSPSGAKSLGEPANEIMAPAIANAVYSATGKRYTTLPIKISIQKDVAVQNEVAR